MVSKGILQTCVNQQGFWKAPKTFKPFSKFSITAAQVCVSEVGTLILTINKKALEVK